jgi:hypothetical protein
MAVTGKDPTDADGRTVEMPPPKGMVKKTQLPQARHRRAVL